MVTEKNINLQLITIAIYEIENAHQVNTNSLLDVGLIENSSTIHNKIDRPEFGMGIFEGAFHLSAIWHIGFAEDYGGAREFLLQFIEFLRRWVDIEQSNFLLKGEKHCGFLLFTLLYKMYVYLH